MTVQNIDHPSFTIGNSPVRLRQDLQVIRIRRGLQTTHVIKDPVNLKYFEFDDHEMALIEKLDSGLGWEEICQWFDHRFPPYG